MDSLLFTFGTLFVGSILSVVGTLVLRNRNKRKQIKKTKPPTNEKQPVNEAKKSNVEKPKKSDEKVKLAQKLFEKPLVYTQKRAKWKGELQDRFVFCMNKNHNDAIPATAATVLTQMNVTGISREQVASHLQKYKEKVESEKAKKVQRKQPKKKKQEANKDENNQEKRSLVVEQVKARPVNQHKTQEAPAEEDDSFFTPVVRGKNGKVNTPAPKVAESRSIQLAAPGTVNALSPAPIATHKLSQAVPHTTPKSEAPKMQLKKQKEPGEAQNKNEEEQKRIAEAEAEKQSEKNKKEKLEALLPKDKGNSKKTAQQKLDALNGEIKKKQKEEARLLSALQEQEKILQKEEKLRQQQIKQLEILSTETSALETKAAAEPEKKKTEKKPVANNNNKAKGGNKGIVKIPVTPKSQVENTLNEASKIKAEMQNKKKNIKQLQSQIKSV